MALGKWRLGPEDSVTKSTVTSVNSGSAQQPTSPKLATVRISSSGEAYLPIRDLVNSSAYSDNLDAAKAWVKTNLRKEPSR